MKKKFIAVIFIAVAACMCMCAFTVDMNSSVKSLTKPYITTYECTSAKLGNQDLLDKYDYLKITFLDDKELELSYKKKNGKKHSYTAPYSYDDETEVISSEIGILGFKFRQATKIENGKFNISMPILGKQLSMVFSS